MKRSRVETTARAALAALAMLVLWCAAAFADERAIRFSLDGELAQPSKIEVTVLKRVTSRGLEGDDDDYDIRLDARQEFALTPRVPRRVDGGAQIRIRQASRTYRADIYTKKYRFLIADTRPPEVPEPAFTSARTGVVKFALRPSLGWPEGLDVLADRTREGGLVDLFVSGGSDALRDVVSASMEHDLLRNWFALTIPAEPVAAGGTWKGQALRFLFALYGDVQFVPAYALTEVAEVEGRRTAKITLSSDRLTYFQPLDPETEVALDKSGFRGEAEYDIAGRFFRRAVLEVYYYVTAKNAAGYIMPLKQKIAMRLRYVRVE